MDANALLTEAKKAREKSYSPYSHFQVGAALLGRNGKIFHGCNIENASFSPTICAERTAFSKAIYEGERVFDAIAIVGGKEGTHTGERCAPCGVCRQVMMEFCDPDKFVIILEDGQGGYKELLLKEMLPFGFGPGELQ